MNFPKAGLFEPRHDPAIEKIDQAEYDRRIGKPGEFPYTRGIHADMYSTGRFPTVRKYGGFGTAEELNRYLRELIQLGVTGLSIAYDLPTQIGLDPDYPLSQGEVGVNGVSIVSLRDYETVFAGILPEVVARGIGVSKTINATAPILLALFIAAAKKQGVDPKELRGTVQNDVLKEYLARNTFIYPLEGTLRLVRDVFAYAKDHLPRFNTISISGYHMREKGSTAAQELAYMFANAIQYVTTAQSGGLSVDAFAPQLSFFINIKKDLFEEVAKLRTARRVWAQIMRDGFGARNPRSWQWRVQSYTGGSDLRREKPHNNMMRDAIRTLASVLAGPQGINITSFDEAITIPTELSQAVAIDTPYIVFLEKSVTQVVDPLGGSYYLEAKTTALEREVWLELDKIAQLSSYQKALAYMTEHIEEQAHKEQVAEDEGRIKVVGKNVQTKNADLFPAVPIFRRDTDTSGATEERQRARMLALKRSRDPVRHAESLRELEQAASDAKQNLMPFILEAVEAYATVGEISDRLRGVFGVASPEAPWEPSRPVPVFSESISAYLREKIEQQNADSSYQKVERALQAGSLDAAALPYVACLRKDRVESPGQFPYTRGLTEQFTVWEVGTGTEGILIDGYQYREAGSTVVQELAFALYRGLRVLRDRSAGGALDATAAQIRLLLSSHNDFFEEIAKFRVARRIWATWLAERWSVQGSEALKLRIQVKTAASTLTREKPWNNIVRTALQALQAALGGVQSIEILPFDANFGKTEWTAWARQMATDMHGILRYEIGLEQVADPLAGSFYLEALTEGLEQAVRAELAHLEAMTDEQADTYIEKALRHCPTLPDLAKQGKVQIVGVNIQKDGPNPQPVVR
jgi:methylmalonyl-CoA mutase N-terminal domain/subunit